MRHTHCPSRLELSGDTYVAPGGRGLTEGDLPCTDRLHFSLHLPTTQRVGLHYPILQMGRLRPLRSREPLHGHAASPQKTRGGTQLHLTSGHFLTPPAVPGTGLPYGFPVTTHGGEGPHQQPHLPLQPVTLFCLLDRPLGSMPWSHWPHPGVRQWLCGGEATTVSLPEDRTLYM